MPRFAANLGWLFPEHPFLERFGAARRAGFGAVEFAVPYEHAATDIAAALQEHRLECILFNVPSGDKSRGDFGLACRPERVEEFHAGVALALDYARTLGTQRINVIAGRERPGDDPRLLRETLVANLRYAARETARAGIGLLVEPINTVDVPGYFFPRCPPAEGLIREVGEANLGLQCDLYHVAMMGDDPAATLTALRPIIRHVQFADAPGRGEPGTGRLDLRALFAQLDRDGYAGWTSAEYRPSRKTEETLGWMCWC